MTRARWARFTKSDWYGFAGAERFEDGGEPFLGELKVTDERGTFDALAIHDANGLQVMWYADDEGADETILGFEGDDARTIFATLPFSVSAETLRAAGAVPLL